MPGRRELHQLKDSAPGKACLLTGTLGPIHIFALIFAPPHICRPIFLSQSAIRIMIEKKPRSEQPLFEAAGPDERGIDA
jgi:hypothetical protein